VINPEGVVGVLGNQCMWLTFALFLGRFGGIGSNINAAVIVNLSAFMHPSG
jgi:hypothetical protein